MEVNRGIDIYGQWDINIRKIFMILKRVIGKQLEGQKVQKFFYIVNKLKNIFQFNIYQEYISQSNNEVLFDFQIGKNLEEYNTYV